MVAVGVGRGVSGGRAPVLPWCYPDERAEGCGQARGAGDTAAGRRRRGGTHGGGALAPSARAVLDGRARSEPVGKGRPLAPFREHAARVGGCRPPRPRQHLGGGWQAEATLGHCNDGVAERPVV